MSISIEISRQAEDVLRNAYGDGLSRAALEAVAIEGYRAGKLSQFEVQTLLGLRDRWETESWLGDKGIHINYRIEDLEADRKSLERGLGPAKS